MEKEFQVEKKNSKTKKLKKSFPAQDWSVVTGNWTDEFPMPLDKPYPVDSNGYPSLDQCLSRIFAVYYLAEKVATGFQALYDNTEGLQNEFAEYWDIVTRTLNRSEYVLGYELINEPFPGDFFKNPKVNISNKPGVWF